VRRTRPTPGSRARIFRRLQATTESLGHRFGVRLPIVRLSAVRCPLSAVRRPAVRRPAVRRPAVRRPAVRRPAVRWPSAAASLSGTDRCCWPLGRRPIVMWISRGSEGRRVARRSLLSPPDSLRRPAGPRTQDPRFLDPGLPRSGAPSVRGSLGPGLPRSGAPSVRGSLGPGLPGAAPHPGRPMTRASRCTGLSLKCSRHPRPGLSPQSRWRHSPGAPAPESSSGPDGTTKAKIVPLASVTRVAAASATPDAAPRHGGSLADL